MPALAAGIQMIDVPADVSGPALHGAIWSPCAKPQGEFARAVKDCPVNGDKLPLVVFSHGRGGPSMAIKILRVLSPMPVLSSPQSIIPATLPPI